MKDYEAYQDLQKRLEKTIREKEVRPDTILVALQTIISNIAIEIGSSFLEITESQVTVHKSIKKMAESNKNDSCDD